MAPSPRKKILAAEDYLKVAPKVVEVARDIKLGRFDAHPAEHSRALRRSSPRWPRSSTSTAPSPG